VEVGGWVWRWWKLIIDNSDAISITHLFSSQLLLSILPSQKPKLAKDLNYLCTKKG